MCKHELLYNRFDGPSFDYISVRQFEKPGLPVQSKYSSTGKLFPERKQLFISLLFLVPSLPTAIEGEKKLIAALFKTYGAQKKKARRKDGEWVC